MDIKKFVAVNLNRVFKNHVYVSNHGPAKGLKRRGGLSFLPGFVPRSTEMAREEAFLERLNLTGQTVYDIGGDQGIYTLFFARKVGAQAGRVITFEPNPVSHEQILTNVGLNNFRHVDVRNIGLGDKKGKLTFVFPGSDPGRGTADEKIGAQILQEKGARALEVDINTLDDEIAESNLPPPAFAKIDVEGLEMSVLRGMKRTLLTHRPQLFIEIHGADVESKTLNIRQVVAFLLECRYDILHVESGAKITNDNAADAKEGHLYCT
ncbi:MAG TPA: FkbM family methyltransferase [Pyrinomonadaceae bacterium]|nr:FkbM family methyltransferase [Pyrinomonadaceae bacterium]